MPDERILAFLDQQYVAEEYSYRNEPLRRGARTFDKVTPLLLHRGGTRHIANVTQLAKSLKLPPPPQSSGAQEKRVAGTPLTVTATTSAASASGSPDEATATPAAAVTTDRSPSRTARENLGVRAPLAKSAVLARLQHKVVVRGESERMSKAAVFEFSLLRARTAPDRLGLLSRTPRAHTHAPPEYEHSRATTLISSEAGALFAGSLCISSISLTLPLTKPLTLPSSSTIALMLHSTDSMNSKGIRVE